MTPEEKRTPDSIRLIARLDATHGALLVIHKALLDHERVRYERVHGVVQSPGQLLQLVINDPWFRWLRTLSGLICQIDEFSFSKEPAIPGAGEALLSEARRLLLSPEAGGDFQTQFARALAESPEVALAHSPLRDTLISPP